MRKSIKEAISSTVNDLIEAGLGDKIMKEEYDLNTMKSRLNPYAKNCKFSPSWHFSLLDDRENRVLEGKAIFSDILEARKRLEKLI